MDSERFLIISTEFPPYDGRASKVGGIGTWMYELAKNMAEAGILITILASNKTPDDFIHDKKQKFKTIRMSRKGWKNFRNLIIGWNLLKAYLSGRCDYVLVASIDLATAPLFLSRFLRFKVASFVHGLDIMQKMSAKEKRKKKRLLEKVDQVIVNSTFVKEQVLKYGIRGHNVAVCNPGVDVNKFASKDHSREIKERFGLNDKIVLTTIGRVIERKGQDMVIKSLPNVIKKVPNIVYLIVGQGGYRSELERLAGEIGVANHVIFTGFIDDRDVVSYFRAADIFIMVSRLIEERGDVEGFGISYIEANMCKKPVIAGRSGGVVDAVEDGVNGLLVNPTDIAGIGEAIIKLCTDKELRARLGEQGYLRALAKFSYRKQINELLETKLI